MVAGIVRNNFHDDIELGLVVLSVIVGKQSPGSEPVFQADWTL